MNNVIDVLNVLRHHATKYSCIAGASILTNKHMNNLSNEKIEQAVVDAVLVDFINYVAGRYCVDYAMYVSDLGQRDKSAIPGAAGNSPASTPAQQSYGASSEQPAP